ncbi:cation diffusion zinc membrane transporter Zrg17 [Botryosphaeria dothidea]
MASDMPIPVPPRTPTPPPEDQQPPVGLGLPDTQLDRDALSPMSATFPPQQLGSLSPSSANLSPRTPNSAYYTPQMSVNSEASTPKTASSDAPQNPFNFKPQQYVVGKPPAKSQDIGRRRGHKYKHSSVSHQIFLEPAPRAPLQVPASLPLPNWSEIRSSMTPEQKMRGLWFERFEVLTGLAMAVILIFTGFDLVSHNLQHALENSGGHESHHAHAHERVSAGSVDTAALAAIIATLISAIGLKNHARISKVLRFAYLESLPSVLSNPSHFLTLSCSSLLLLLPLLSIEMYIWLDRSITAFIAVSMMLLGWRLGWSLGRILMMSYSGPGLEGLLRMIEADPAVSSIEEAKVWQVHYGLCQANFKLRVRSLDDMAKLRDRVQSLVRNKLAGGYGRGGEKWEVSTQLTLDKD